jgi:glycosyltransferase involved in cell wall biosynthesis
VDVLNSDHAREQTTTKVLRVIARLNVGGPSVQAITLSRFLDDRGYETRLVRGREAPREGSMDGLAEELRVRPLGLPAMKRNLGLGDALALLFLVREIRKWRPDILHTHASKAGALGRIAAILAGRKRPRVIVHTFHGHVLSGYFSPRVSVFFTAVERMLARVTTRLVAVSAEVRDDLIRLRVAPPNQIVVVPLGFDLSPFDVPEGERQARRSSFRDAVGIPRDASVVTLVARIEPIKRVDRFLRVARLVSGVNDAHFLIVGDGEMREELEKAPDAQALGSNVTWTGIRTDMPDVYFASDMVAITSDNEGTAVSAIEAQAARLPVVSTRVGGMRSVVSEGKTGFLVDAKDEGALATAIETLLRDRALARQFGEHAANRARRMYSLDRLLADIDELYQGMLSDARRGEFAKRRRINQDAETPPRSRQFEQNASAESPTERG